MLVRSDVIIFSSVEIRVGDVVDVVAVYISIGCILCHPSLLLGFLGEIYYFLNIFRLTYTGT